MEVHDFLAGPNGLCEKCGKPRKECLFSNEVYITGLHEVEGMHVNKAVIFFEQIPDNCKVQQICCSKFNTFILSTSGQVFSWGETTNALGRVLEKRDDAKVPKIVYDLNSRYIVSISCGESHILALDYEKFIWSWGFNKFGQLGHGDTIDRNIPTQIKTIKAIVKISAAANFSYGVSENGRVHGWGDNKNFQLGQMVDEKGVKQSKFLFPTLIANNPWDKSVDIQIAGGNGNNYFFKSTQSKVAKTEYSQLETKKLILENEELKKKIDFLNKKLAILEEELYKNNPNINPQFGMTQDTAIEEMQILLKKNIQRCSEIEKKSEEYNEEILRLSKDIKGLENLIKDLDTKEALYWDEIEAKDNDLLKLENKKNKENRKIAEIRTKRELLHEMVKTIENTRSNYYLDLNNKQELFEKITDNKSQLGLELLDCEKKTVLYKQMIGSREKEIQRIFLKKKQKNIGHEIIASLKNRSFISSKSSNLRKWRFY
jgi:Regulator of chromosome condensation (RCC1) repeat